MVSSLCINIVMGRYMSNLPKFFIDSVFSRRFSFLFIALLTFFLCRAEGVYADEVRVGVSVHDSKFFKGKTGKEESLSVTGEYIWDTPGWLEWVWGARPYIGGTVNAKGETHHGGGGIMWRKSFFHNVYGDYSFGLVMHSGHIRTPNPSEATTDEEINIRQARRASEIEFGSRVLFRQNLALGYRFSKELAGEITFEHLSHGNIIGGPENEGSNNFGARIAYRF
ncbi:MAG: hypothetical protein COA43_11715 [Robiginitomaculum sp.]|nr:MAG: hypothetical protein COA43_11715 [Robiginitomaculum sp.]